MKQIRTIKTIIEPTYVMEGAGVRLLRSISPHSSNMFDPFLLFDHFAFNDPIEGPIRGFPMHPHRGIETVSYILEGSINHRDSLGNSGTIGPGAVQWMTSGRGILHEEMPHRGQSGIINGFQLWVNLPAASKMSSPRYQEISSDAIPEISIGGVKLRLIAGSAFGVTGPVTKILANPTYIDVTLEPDAEFIHEIPSGHSALAYIFEGQGSFITNQPNGTPNSPITAIKLVKFNDGDHVIARANSQSTFRFLLIAGSPFNEPIVPYGPFVMNTAAEIQQALIDLRNGNFIKG